MLTKACMDGYLAILEEELVKATGCTEPIAIAYCAAILRKVLKKRPEEILVEVSGNILKNVKSVIVPNTGGLRGIPAAVAAGIVAGREDLKLQVIASVPEEMQSEISNYLHTVPMKIVCMDTPCMLDIRLTGKAGADQAIVRIANNHTNIVYVEYCGEILRDLPLTASAEQGLQDKHILNVADIVHFADEIALEQLIPVLKNQIHCNSAIAERGIFEHWGAQIGATMMRNSGDNLLMEAAAYAAAGSDARMSGCELPVVILSGSGNQGITASMPVYYYAKKIHASQEALYRALAVSDLVTIHQKTGIGRLSAYCGAVSAGVGAGAGIAYLRGGKEEAISATVSNAVAILSGTICDGAKPSCAAKIYHAVEAGIMGYEMYCNGNAFSGGDGIVGADVEKTIDHVGRLAREGMRQTDRVILSIMTEV